MRGTGILLGGKRIAVPGVNVVNFLDDPSVRTPDAHTNPRREPMTLIVLHTVDGRLGGTHQCSGASSRDYTYAHYDATAGRDASWDVTVDTDGSVIWQNDPLVRFTWNANQVNPRAMGFEMVQETDGTTYACQYEALARVVDVVTNAQKIPRFIPWYQGAPDRRVFARLSDAGGAGRGMAGIIGHRNVTHNRGPGDPGDGVYWALAEKGYVPVDYEAGQDRTKNGRVLRPVDIGIASAASMAALLAAAGGACLALSTLVPSGVRYAARATV